MAHKGWLSIKVTPQDAAKIAHEARELGMPVSFYVMQVLRNQWQDPRVLKVLPPPVVNPWRGKEIVKEQVA